MALQAAPPPLREAAPPMPPGASERALAERRTLQAPGGDLVSSVREAGQRVIVLARERPDLAEEASNLTSALMALVEKAQQPPPMEGPPGMPPGAGPPMGGPPGMMPPIPPQ